MDVILNNLTSMFIFKESWILVLEYALFNVFIKKNLKRIQIYRRCSVF